jgi:uncharacterized protein YjbJ (UPF0337 family)
VWLPVVRVRVNPQAGASGGSCQGFSGGIIVGFIDKAKNKAEEMLGEAKEKIGEATGDRQQQAEGQTDQVTGNLKQAGEKVKDAFSG